jgi:hypothetical protein
MLADHFTKPRQSSLFRKFRAEIQGIPVDLSDSELGWYRDPSCELKKWTNTGTRTLECVGNDSTSFISDVDETGQKPCPVRK